MRVFKDSQEHMYCCSMKMMHFRSEVTLSWELNNTKDSPSWCLLVIHVSVNLLIRDKQLFSYNFLGVLKFQLKLRD